MERNLKHHNAPGVNLRQETSSETTQLEETTTIIPDSPGSGLVVKDSEGVIDFSIIAMTDKSLEINVNTKPIVCRESVSITEISMNESTIASATAKSIAMDMSDVHINHMSSLEVRFPMGDEFVLVK